MSPAEASVPAPTDVEPCAILWQPWKPGSVEEATENGKIVWLSFASDWDITRHLRDSLFRSSEFLAELGEHRIALIEVDCTDRDPAVERELKRYGRDHLPTNLIFPAHSNGEMIILPDHLTQESVSAALDQAESMNR